jgi:gamma-glutamylaminecyclotransferase
MILKTKRPYIAHFRYATIGEVSKANCHPFDINKDNILFQNGTVYGLGNKKKTDTQHLAEILSDVPPNRWREVLEMNDSRFVTANLKTKKYTLYNKSDWTKVNDIWYSKTNVLDKVLIGVYGTLKRYGSNYDYHLADSIYVGKANTVEKYPMLIQGIPYVLDKPGVGHHIDIELFLVDRKTCLPSIDRLEGHPTWYERRQAEVILEDMCTVLTPYIYFNDTVKDEGEHHKTFTQEVYGFYDNPLLGGSEYYECQCANPEPVLDYNDHYCDICYGNIIEDEHIINQFNF